MIRSFYLAEADHEVEGGGVGQILDDDHLVVEHEFTEQGTDFLPDGQPVLASHTAPVYVAHIGKKKNNNNISRIFTIYFDGFLVRGIFYIIFKFTVLFNIYVSI